jgi:hypothetical protein
MSKSGRTLLGLVAATSLVAVACSDASRSFPTGPDRATRVAKESPSNLLGGVLGLLIAPVKRNSPLANDVVWSFYASPTAGGYTSNSSLGLTVAIPPGAVTQTVKITVTAMKGAPVAYGFSPHLEFKRKVYITQNLKGTSAGLLTPLLLKGAHFPGDRPQYTSDGMAIVDEVVPALLSNLLGGLLGTLTRTMTFGVDHFTGWIVASGSERSYDSY